MYHAHIYNIFIFPFPHIFHHTYRASWYYQSLFYSPTDAQVNCLKNNIKIDIKIYINP